MTTLAYHYLDPLFDWLVGGRNWGHAARWCLLVMPKRCGGGGVL